MLIGITTNCKNDEIYLPKFYIEAVQNAGGTAIILPTITTNLETYTTEISQKLDGLILSGGGDPSPLLWGEEPHYNLGAVDAKRDKFELALIQKMAKLDKAILGICRGAQIINVAFGGSLWQDLKERSDYMCHSQTADLNQYWHKISLAGKLLELLNQEAMTVNSNHHQGIRRLGENLEVGAVAADGLVEAIYSTKHKFVLGVQWHPERLDHEPSQKIFQQFVKMCQK